MSLSFNTKHYTYHVGSGATINTADKIAYYVSSDILAYTGQSISVQGITRFMSDVIKVSGINGTDGELGVLEKSRLTKSAPGTVGLVKKGDKDMFDLVQNYPGQIKFDVVVYLDKSGNGLGYTVFSGLQSSTGSGISVDRVKLRFYFQVSTKVVQFDPVFGLDSIRAKQPEIDQFCCLPSQKPSRNTQYWHYTDDLQILAATEEPLIVPGNSWVISGDHHYSVPPIPSVSMFDGHTQFNQFSVSILGNDLALTRWNADGDVRVDSLSRTNHFGVPLGIIPTQKLQGITNSWSGVAELADGTLIRLDTGETIKRKPDPWTGLSGRTWIWEKSGPGISGLAGRLDGPGLVPITERSVLSFGETGITVSRFVGPGEIKAEEIPYQYSEETAGFYDAIRHKPLISKDFSFLREAVQVVGIRGYLFWSDGKMVNSL